MKPSNVPSCGVVYLALVLALHKQWMCGSGDETLECAPGHISPAPPRGGVAWITLSSWPH